MILYLFTIIMPKGMYGLGKLVRLFTSKDRNAPAPTVKIHN